MDIELNPETPQEGQPITILLRSAPDSAVSQLSIHSFRGDLIMAPLERVADNVKIARFALYEAGQYVVAVGDEKRIFKVSPREDLSFHLEFGLLAVCVVSILGGLVIWSRKKKRSEPGSI